MKEEQKDPVEVQEKMGYMEERVKEKEADKQLEKKEERESEEGVKREEENGRMYRKK